MRFLVHLQNYLLPLAVLLLACTLQLARPWPVEFVQNLVFDQYNRWKPRVEKGSPVVFVDIDENSLARLGQFPWPRNIFAQLVTRMDDYGSTAIAFDVLFAEADRTAPKQIFPIWNGLRGSSTPQKWHALKRQISEQITDPDQAFSAAIAEAPVVAATMLSHEGHGLPKVKAGIVLRAHGSGKENIDPMRSLPTSDFAIVNRPEMENAATGLGAINARIDRDGIIRRAPLLFRVNKNIYPSLSLESLRVAQRSGSIVLRASNVRGEGSYTSGFGLSRLKVGQIIAPIEPDGSIRLYFAKSEDIDRVSAHEILEPDFQPERLAGKIVFVGTSAAGLKDLRATPLNQATPGVEVHIQTAQQMIAGAFLKRPVWIQLGEVVITLLAGLTAISIIRRLAVIPAGLAALVCVCTLSWYSFSEHLILIDPVLPSLSVFITFLTASFLHYYKTARERREIRDAFKHYLPYDIVKQVAFNPDKLKLGGETRNLTILFADIRDFTTISEVFADAPNRLTYLINIFLTGMSKIIQNYSGTIDKYIGDNIMAFWNAPIDIEHHAYEACCAAIDMIEALPEINANLSNDPMLDGWQGEMRIGIGLNSGSTLVGNIGSDQRFNYSVIGDTVNVSSRLEQQTKIYGVPILVGENTYTQACATVNNGRPALAFVELDRITLKGKTQPERIYALIGGAAMAAETAFSELLEDQAALLRLYRRQEWDAAEILARQMCKTHPVMADFCAMVIARMVDYRNQPPGAEWDGHYITVSK